MSRAPVVAGRFYEGTSAKLIKEIEGLAGKEPERVPCLGAVSPHAGFIYSGQVAAKTIASIKKPDTFIILGPNHTGLGSPVSVLSEESWETPLGIVEIDKEIAAGIFSGSKTAVEDASAHANEHSIEVQLPFIQYFHKGAKIVPVCIAVSSLAKLVEFGEGIAKAVKSSKKNVCILASSDMSHYEPQEIVKKKDKEAIDAIIKLDEKLLYENVRKYGITMCGVSPAIAMLAAVKKLGAEKAQLVKYMTSGETSGDYDAVVGYAGIIIK